MLDTFLITYLPLNACAYAYESTPQSQTAGGDLPCLQAGMGGMVGPTSNWALDVIRQ